MSLPQTPESFWKRVRKGSKDACWPWTGSKNSTGYGTVAWNGRVVQAHRVAYFLTHPNMVALETGFRKPGRARQYSKFVLHTCDVRECCNPAHLFLGSMSTNLLDAYKKGRKQQPTGHMHINSRLTTGDAKRIRMEYAQGRRQVDLAQKYGISQRAISLIVRRETYRDE